MKWASAISDSPSFTEAVTDACEQVLLDLEGQAPDLAIVFISAHHASSYYSAPELIIEKLSPGALIGCSAAGVIGAGHEVERRSAVAVCAATMPGVNVHTFAVENFDLPDMDAPPETWEELIGAPASECPAIILLPDPFSIPAGDLLSGLDYAYPRAVKVGGLVSGGEGPGSNALFIGKQVRRSGLVGAAFTGDLVVDSVVAQGCKPIGQPMVITESDRNIILSLDGEQPLDVLRSLFQQADDGERRLIERSLQIGIVMDPLNDSFAAGDFLIRNVIGADEQDGTLAVGELVQEGQVVQFHVQDADAADEDLRVMLERYAEGMSGGEPASALLFTCLGRGQKLFGAPDHETGRFRSIVAPIPVTGFFGNGEIGPVGGATFLHGYTSSFAVFKPSTAISAR